MEPLTTAELRALHALARYETATEAAQAAKLSPQTLRNQAYSAYQKLGVNGKIDAFRKIGWLRPPRFMPSAEDPEPFGRSFLEEVASDEDEEAIRQIVQEADPNVVLLSEKLADRLQAPMIARYRAEQAAKRSHP